jgi:hypothetical protein
MELLCEWAVFVNLRGYHIYKTVTINNNEFAVHTDKTKR